MKREIFIGLLVSLTPLGANASFGIEDARREGVCISMLAILKSGTNKAENITRILMESKINLGSIDIKKALGACQPILDKAQEYRQSNLIESLENAGFL